MIQSDNTTLFIEPIKTEDENAARLNSIHRKHLVYRSTDVIHDAPVFDKREKAPAIGKGGQIVLVKKALDNLLLRHRPFTPLKSATQPIQREIKPS